MDRQGNRVRFTRLILPLVGLAFVCICGVWAAQNWWKRLTSDNISDQQQTEQIDRESTPSEHSNEQDRLPHSNSPDGNRTVTFGTNAATNNGEQSSQPSENATPLNTTGTNAEPTPTEMAQPPQGSHPLDEVLDLARRALINHRSKHHDFTAKLSKTERINNRLLPTTVMAMKLRYRDLQPGESIRGTDLYFHFLEPRAQAGREVIYAPLKYDGKIKAHEGGLLGLFTVDLTPNSQLAMRGNRYPLTEAGIEKLIVKLIEKGERDRARGDCIVNRHSGSLVGDVECELIEVIHPQPTYQIDGQEFPHEFFKAQIWFDMEELVPIKYSSYSWPDAGTDEPRLEEEYTYAELKLNSNLSDLDFDITNKAYSFP